MSSLVQSKTIFQFLSSSAFKNAVQTALPRHVSTERMLRIFTVEIKKNKKLAECPVDSLLGCLMQCSQLGVEPGGVLGHAYLIPYKGRCQFILGYRGMIDIALRSNKVKTIKATVVYDCDKFSTEEGLTPNLLHHPNYEFSGEKKIRGAYAVASLADNIIQFQYMPVMQIEKIKARSESARSNYSPWNTDYEEMAKKTVIRRLFKYLPISVEMSNAVAIDELGDKGKYPTVEIDSNTIESLADYITYEDVEKPPVSMTQADEFTAKVMEGHEFMKD